MNSDLKVRSLPPSIRWTTSLIVGRRCRTRTDIQSLEGSVLILLNEAPSYSQSGAGCRNRTCFVSLKRRVHSRICQSRNLLVGDAGIEPAWSRLRGECISHLCQSPITSGRRGGSRTHMNLIRSQVPDPFSHTPSCKLVQDVGIEPTPRDYRSRARPSS